MFRSRATLREEWETQQELRAAARGVTRICAIVEQLLAVRMSQAPASGGGLGELLGGLARAIPQRGPAPAPVPPAEPAPALPQFRNYAPGQVVNGQMP